MGNKPRRRPLDAEIVAAVRKLLRRGKLSQRRIAKLLGIAHGSVQAIAAGTWGRPVPWRRRRLKTPEHCSGCGGKIIQKPCVLCLVRALPGTIFARPSPGRQFYRRLDD